MSVPPIPYTRQANFTNFATEQFPTTGQDLEAEFNKLAQSVGSTQSRLAEIQRDDGLLANLSVHPDSLSHAVRSLLAAEAGVPRGNWAPGVIYQPKDVVMHDGASYLAATEHTAGADFDADLAAGKWLLLSFANDGGTLRVDLASLAPGNGASLVQYDADETVRDRLDALASDAGASLVGFKQAASGAVERSVQSKLRDRISLLDFIPESEHAAIRAYTSTYDATAAINSAYAQAKAVRGTLWCPSGLYNVSSTITLDGQASIVGEGGVASNLDMELVTDKAMTLFRWAGAAGGTVFNQTGRIGAIDIGNFAVDCSNLADVGIRFDRLRHSRIFGVMVVNWRANPVGKAGILIKPQPDYPNDNFMFNDIGPLYLRGPTCCLRLAAAGGNSNTCHNTFRQLNLDTRGDTTNYCMVIEDADNNTFWMIYTFNLGAPGSFAVVHEAGSRSNYFFHFQGAMWAKAGSKNMVFGYDRENGQSPPTVDPGAELFWTENGNNATRWNMTSMLRGVCVEQSGDWTPGNPTWVDSRAFKHFRPDIGSYASWTFRNSPRQYEMWVSVDSSGPYNVMSFGNNQIGFFGASPQLKPTVTGSRGGNAALGSLLSALAALGLINNNSTS